MKRAIATFVMFISFLMMVPSIQVNSSEIHFSYGTAYARSFNFWRQLKQDFLRDQEREVRNFSRNISRDYLSFLRKRISDSYRSPRNSSSSSSYNQPQNVTINVAGEHQVYSFSQKLNEKELEVLALIVEYSPNVGINEIPVDRNYTREKIIKLCNSGSIPYRYIGSIKNRAGQLIAVQIERI